MKRFCFIISLVLLPMVSRAQFLVEESGKAAVGMQYSSDNPLLSKVSINTRGDSKILSDFNATNFKKGLRIQRTDSDWQNTERRVGLEVISNNSQYHDNFGIRVDASGNSALGFGYSYGIWAKAGNIQASGGNFGVCASIVNGDFGAAIYGSTGGNPNGTGLGNGSWAGYFDGGVYVTQSVSASSFLSASDYRLKENIRSFSSRSLDDIMDMNVVTYNYKQIEINTGDSVPSYKFDPDSPILSKTHYGLIAQELREIYPELVYEDGNGYLSVNYVELVPILIKSIQELKTELDDVKKGAVQAPTRSSVLTEQPGEPDIPVLNTSLYQNAPNPFTESTVIRCDIGRGVSDAVLYLYDMNGRQIDSRMIAERGATEVTIEGGSLDAGIYMYSLIADGQVIDTKRMILTK